MSSVIIRLFFRILLFIGILVLPFIILIRGAVLVHSEYNLGPFSSLLAGIGGTVLLLVIYMTYVHGRFTNRLGDYGAFKTRLYFALLIIVGFCIHAIFFLSSRHVKSNDVRNELRELHPIIRLAVSTITFLDKDLLITDASRLPEDYRRMGLPTKRSSLHFTQKDGYAYAVDLRTNGSPEFRNYMLSFYFRLMGFRSLRHYGTDDHLHISLNCHFLPGGL